MPRQLVSQNPTLILYTWPIYNEKLLWPPAMIGLANPLIDFFPACVMWHDWGSSSRPSRVGELACWPLWLGAFSTFLHATSGHGSLAWSGLAAHVHVHANHARLFSEGSEQLFPTFFMHVLMCTCMLMKTIFMYIILGVWSNCTMCVGEKLLTPDSVKIYVQQFPARFPLSWRLSLLHPPRNCHPMFFPCPVRPSWWMCFSILATANMWPRLVHGLLGFYGLG